MGAKSSFPKKEKKKQKKERKNKKSDLRTAPNSKK
jgi:hypothetical protein